MIGIGDKLPDAHLLHVGTDGPTSTSIKDITDGKKTVIFGLPGAYTNTCDKTHMPSFIRTADAFRAKGVDNIVCITVNDAFIVTHWENSTGATKAGITVLGDATSEFTKSIGMEFSVPPLGFYDRSQRYAMLVEDGVVTILNTEEAAGACELTVGENLLDKM